MSDMSWLSFCSFIQIIIGLHEIFIHILGIKYYTRLQKYNFGLMKKLYIRIKVDEWSNLHSVEELNHEIV